MVEAFRKLPGRPVYSPRLTASRRHRPSFDIVTLSAHYLAAHPTERRFLFAWASARASGRSVRESCRELGWPRETFRRRRDAACRIVAEGLNRDGILTF